MPEATTPDNQTPDRNAPPKSSVQSPSQSAAQPMVLRESALTALAVVGVAGVLSEALGAPSMIGVALVLVAVIIGTVILLSGTRRDEAPVRVDALDRLRSALAASPRESGEELVALVRERLAGANLAASNLRAVLDADRDPVIATDSAGELIIWNRAAADFFDRPHQALQGRIIDELFTQSEVLGLHAGAVAGHARAAQVRMSRRGAMRVYEVVAAPAALELAGLSTRSRATYAEPGVVLTLRDVTELARAVQLKTDFVANASHELRTPLSSIKAAAETLGEMVDEPPMAARLVLMIAANTTRLEELTRDLLDLSRLETPEASIDLAPVRLAELFESLAPVFETPCKERNLRLVFEASPDASELTSDPRLLSLILKNLIENSTKFAYEGTTIRVVASRPSPRDGVRLQVIDQGIGIPLNAQDRIFERFYQVDLSRAGGTSRRGTGLGLAIVKHAAKALGGTVSVQSVWKEGTTMSVDLPTIPPAPKS
ncbi:MAG: PAS domain-containing protein [Phycisphaerae bacterium]|nr:PAS domain-containing protein [Phycisphaerae bacterium]